MVVTSHPGTGADALTLLDNGFEYRDLLVPAGKLRPWDWFLASLPLVPEHSDRRTDRQLVLLRERVPRGPHVAHHAIREVLPAIVCEFLVALADLGAADGRERSIEPRCAFKCFSVSTCTRSMERLLLPSASSCALAERAHRAA